MEKWQVCLNTSRKGCAHISVSLSEEVRNVKQMSASRALPEMAEQGHPLMLSKSLEKDEETLTCSDFTGFE